MRGQSSIMAPSAVALVVISLFAGAYSAPQLCISCATSGSLRQHHSSQRSENLEDLTQQAATELHRIPTQLAFDNSRPGNWEEQNQYRTPDGHGQVFEEQGQRVDGGRRIRYYRKNFTSSYSSSNAGGLAGTDLGGFDSSGRQSVTHNYLGQGQNGAFDQSTTHGNSYLSRGSGQHSLGGYESYARPSTGYQSTHDQTSTSGDTYVSQDSSRTVGRLTSENSHGFYGRPSSVYSAVDQGQNAGYDQTITRGNSYVAEGSSQTTGGLTGQNSYGRYDSYGRPLSGGQTVDHFAVDQGQGAGYDQTITRGNSYVAEGSSQTTGGLTGQNSYRRYDSYGRPLSGGQTVDHSAMDHNSHIYQSSGVDGRETQRGSAVWDQTRPGNWTEADTYRTDGGRGIVHEQQGQYVTGPKQVRYYAKNYTSSYTSGGGVPSTGSGLDSSSILEREMQNLNREIQQLDRTIGTGSTFTQTSTGHNVRPIVVRPVSNYPAQHPSTSGSNSYHTYRHTQTTQDTSSLPGVVPLSSDSQALRNYYDRLTQTQQSQYVQTYGTRGLSQSQISQSNSRQEPGQVRHYEQSQTSSTSSSQHPGVDTSVLQVSSNNGRQQTYNSQNSFGRTSGYNQGSVYTVPSGQLVTHAIDLGQVAQGPDCDEGTSGYSQYQQTQRLRTYRRASQSDDLTQQTEDLTQQTQDLTQQTEDLTQQTEDLTQQTEDLTQQSQHVDQFGQHSSWKPGKLEFGSQQVQDLTQQVEDLTQQTQDLTQQTEDLTQQTEDLTQQTQQVDQFGQHSSWKPGKLEFGSQQGQDLTQQTEDLTQQTQDLTQQTEDLTQQTEDLAQQTQHMDQFGQHSSWKPGKLEFGSQQSQDLTQQTQDLTQQTEDLTQQTEDLTQQTEDLTQQTEDLSQQTQHVDQFGQHSSWKPGKLEFGSQQNQDLPQQTQGLTQQTEDLTQQTQDLTQQTEDLTQQTEDLTQQTEDLTQQTQDLTQQTEDLTQQTEDLTQQTQQVDQFGQHSSWKPGKLEFGSQQGQDLTQQTEDLTQQTQDLTQQTEDLTQQTEDLAQQTQHMDQFGQHSSWKPGKLEFGSQQGQDLSQQTEDLTQQTEDLTQQTEDLTQQTEDLAQQTQHMDQFGQHSSWKPGKLEFGSQQGQDLTQQTEDLTQQTQDLTQQTEDLTQQTEDLAQQTQHVDQFGQPSSWKPGKLEFGSQQGQDLTQQTEDLTQQTRDLTQQTEDLTQQTEDLAQELQHVDQFGQQSSWKPGQLEFGSQQGQDLSQQTEDLTQQTEDLTQQAGQHWQIGEPNYVPFVERPPEIVQISQYPGIQQGEDLSQQTQDSGDFGQQTSWNYGQLESGNHQVEDLTQQTQDSGDFGQQTSWNYGHLESGNQQVEDLTQQTQDSGDFGQQTGWNYGQSQTGHHQVEDLTQQTQSSGDFGQQTSWDSHNQGSGFNRAPIIPGQGAIPERRPAPKPQGRPRPTSSYYIYPVTIQVTEEPKIDAIPLNYAQENNQKWETAEDLHHSEKEVAVPAAPKRGDQGVDPDSTEDEDYLAGVSTEPTTPKSLDQAKRFTKTGRRSGYRGPQYRPQVIEPLAHYVQKSEQQSAQKSEQLEVQPLPVISPRILEAYGNGPYDADHRPDFGSVKPNPNVIITPPETDAWDVSARGFSAPRPPPVITTPEPTTTEEPTTTSEPTTTTPAPGFWGRLGHKITNTYEKAKEKAKELIG